MKILIINYEYPPYGGGAANATKEIACALKGMGHEVEVLTSGQGTLRFDQDGIKKIQVGSRRAKVEGSNVWEMSEFILRGIGWARTQKPSSYDSIIAFFSLPCGVIARFLNKRLNVDYIVSLRGGDVPGFSPEIGWIHRLLMPTRRSILKNSKAVVANSQSLAKLARAADQVESKIITNGVDTTFFSPAAKKGPLGVTINILIVARLHKQKNIVNAVEILSEVKRNGLSINLVIVGDGPERVKIEKVIRKNQLQSWIKLKGWISRGELVEEYRSANFFLSLSTIEGMSNAVLEAMSCALTVILSDVPSHRELLQNRAVGFLVADDYAAEITRILSDFGENHKKFVKVGQQGRQLVRDEYSWHSVAEQYLRLLD